MALALDPTRVLSESGDEQILGDAGKPDAAPGVEPDSALRYGLRVPLITCYACSCIDRG
jgi:hypothetical protein